MQKIKQLSPRTTGDDRKYEFRTELFGVATTLNGEVVQYASLQCAQVVTVCSRQKKVFYEDCTEPDAEPWFLVKCHTIFISGGGYSSPVHWNVFIMSNGEVFFPVKLAKNQRYRDWSMASLTPTEPLATINISSGSVDWTRFGPTDKELVQRAIAVFLGRLQK